MPIRVRDLSPVALKSKNVATELYVDNHIETVNNNIDGVETAVVNARDNLAVQLGYENYVALTQAAAAGTTVITGGYINTSLIDTDNLTVKNVSVNEGASGAHLSIANNVIKAYDANGVLRVKLGDLNA